MDQFEKIENPRADSSAAAGTAHEDQPSQLSHRIKMTGAMVGAVGVRSTAGLVHDYLRQGYSDRSIAFRNRVLEYPVQATGRDIANFNEIIKQRVYELPEKVSDEINGKPIIDAGAYIGLAAGYLASRHPRSPILSIEPHARNTAYLELNAEPYTLPDGRRQIDVVHGAFAPESGIAHMTVRGRDETDYMSNMFTRDEVMDEQVVQAVSPQDVLNILDNPSEIGLFKVDIEGAEKELFESSEIHEILKITDMVMVETHDQFVSGSHAATVDAMAQHGMEPAPLNPHTTLYMR